MSDLLKEFEEFIDRGFEDLLGLVRELEGRGDGEFRVDVQTRTQVDRRNFSQEAIPEPDDLATSDPIEDVIITPPVVDSDPSETLQGIGGLSEIVRELRELVELPLKRSDLLTKLGLEPPRGVLLVGPPGTGKTLTARALAEDLGVNYIAIVGPEIMGKYYGEAEARLRSLFEKASRSAPCIIFIDEIDSLALESRRRGRKARGCSTVELDGWVC